MSGLAGIPHGGPCHCGKRLPWHLIELGARHHCTCGLMVTRDEFSQQSPAELKLTAAFAAPLPSKPRNKPPRESLRSRLARVEAERDAALERIKVIEDARCHPSVELAEVALQRDEWRRKYEALVGP